MQRYLAYQTDGAGNLLYAATFALRRSADNAARAADERRSTFARVTGNRPRTVVVKLPVDRR